MDARSKRGRWCGSGLRRAFTLIEVLVVVAIIALLVAILLPSLANARRQTRVTLCSSQLHQIGLAFFAYQQTYKEFPQQSLVNGEAFGLMTTATHQTLARFLMTGFKDSLVADEKRAGELFYCPEVRDQDRAGDIKGEDQVSPTDPAYLHITYAYLGRLSDGSNDPAAPRSSLGETKSRDVPNKRKYYVTKEPDARYALMTDMVMWWGRGGTATPRWRINHGPWYKEYFTGQKPLFRGANLAHGDGHVAWNKATQFPAEMRNGADRAALVKTALLIRAVGDGQLWW